METVINGVRYNIDANDTEVCLRYFKERINTLKEEDREYLLKKIDILCINSMYKDVVDILFDKGFSDDPSTIKYFRNKLSKMFRKNLGGMDYFVNHKGLIDINDVEHNVPLNITDVIRSKFINIDDDVVPQLVSAKGFSSSCVGRGELATALFFMDAKKLHKGGDIDIRGKKMEVKYSVNHKTCGWHASTRNIKNFVSSVALPIAKVLDIPVSTIKDTDRSGGYSLFNKEATLDLFYENATKDRQMDIYNTMVKCVAAQYSMSECDTDTYKQFVEYLRTRNINKYIGLLQLYYYIMHEGLDYLCMFNDTGMFIIFDVSKDVAQQVFCNITPYIRFGNIECKNTSNINTQSQTPKAYLNIEPSCQEV